MPDTTEHSILHDELIRSLRIMKDAGPKGWAFTLLHPVTTARHLHSVTAPHPLVKSILDHQDRVHQGKTPD
jgi:hypothetical protein